MPATIPQPTMYGDARTPWRFVLTTLAGADLGEITGLEQRKLIFGLNRATTFEATMDISHPVMATMMNQSNQHLLVKAYKRGTLMATLEIATGELRGTNETHKIRLTGTCTAYARLRQRHVARSIAGTTYTGDRTTVAAAMLGEANAAKATGVVMGSTGSTSTITVGPWRYKPLLGGIAELGATLNGYDHWITPTDPYIDSIYGYLNCAALRGSVKDGVIFSYGTGNVNAREYALQWDTTFRITRALSLPPDFPDNALLPVIERQAFGYAAIEDTEKVGMREAMIENDLRDLTLRTLLMDEHLAVRKQPRQLFEIQPFTNLGDGSVPDFGFDYDIGDIVEGRVVDSGLVMLNAMVRVYQATVEIDDAGVEQITLGMVDEETTGS